MTADRRSSRTTRIALAVVLLAAAMFAAEHWSRGWLRFALPAALFVVGALLGWLPVRLRAARLRRRQIAYVRDNPPAPVPVADRPEPRREVAALGMVPPVNSQFRGRETELEALLRQHDRLRARLRADDLGSPRGRPLILLLHGKPGVGKTATAQELTRRLQASYDLVLYANLGYAGDAAGAGEVLRQFLQALGVDQVPDDPSLRLSLYRETVEQHRVLILLDAVRGPWQIADLLPNSIESTVLVTSRRDLGPEFGFRSHHLDVLTADDAIAMLYAVAQKDEPGYPMSASTITWLCGRLPRAISIVGGWVISDGRDLVDAANWLNFDDHIDETERLRRLVGPKENVRAGFETEYADLEPAQRRAFCLSALIQASSFTARTVAVLLDSTIEEAESLCGALRTAQFLDPDPETGPEVVYRLHPLVRLFAADRLQLDFAAEKAAARTRLDEDMARHVRAVGSVRSGQSAPDDAAGAAARDAAGNTYRWMRGHLPEIVRGLGSLPGGGDVLLLADLVTEAPGLLCRSYGLTDLSKLLRSGMGPDCAALTKVDLKVAFAAALIAVEDYVLAERVLNEARDLLPDGKPGDPELAFRQSAIWRTQATGYAQMRSPKIADAHFQRAYTCLDGITGERADYERRVITLLQYLSHGANLANVEYPPEEFGEAYRFWIHLERHEEYRNRRLWDQALAELDLAQECCTGDLRKETNVLYRRARLYLEHSEASPDTDRLRLANLAVRRAADAVRRFREMDNRVGQVRAGCLLVRALAAAGEIGEAALQWDAAQAIYDDGLQDVAGPAMDPLRARLIAARGELLLAQGEHTAASAEFLKAANQFDRISDGRGRQRYLNRIRR